MIKVKTSCFILVSLLLVVTPLYFDEAIAEIYYISTDGDDSNDGTIKSPWNTFSYSMGKLESGDTLIIMDGTYNETLNMSVSGVNGNPITFKAQNDGKAIIDGQNKRLACAIEGNESNRIHDLIVEGIRCQNSIKHAVKINYSDRITFRRVSAYNANPLGNYHVISVNRATDTLLEDCAASGTGRTMIMAYESHNITIRRCWGMWTSHNDDRSSRYVIYLYGTTNSRIENSIVTRHSNENDRTTGFGVITNRWNSIASSNNKLYGNIAYDLPTHAALQTHSATKNLTNNEYVDNVFINTKGGFFYRAGDEMLVNRLTVADTFTYGMFVTNPYDEYDDEIKLKADCDFRMNATLKNSSFVSGESGISKSGERITLKDSCELKYTTPLLTHSHNNIFEIIDPKEGGNGYKENTMDPNYSTAKYGRGAYLIRPDNLKNKDGSGPDIGAEVLFRYENSELTSIPLWPWPMEDRIKTETAKVLGKCFSPTFDNAGNGCTGGLWKSPEVINLAYQGNDSETNNSSFTDNNAVENSSNTDNNETNNSPFTDNYNFILKVNPLGTYIDAENFTDTMTQGISEFTKEYTESNYAGTGYITPNGPSNYDCANNTEGKEYQLNFQETGTYNIWIRGYGSDPSSDSVFVGFDGECIGAMYENKVYNQWVWINKSTGLNTIDVTSPGIHTINIWLREPNFLVDGIYLTQGTEPPPDDIDFLDSIPPAPPVALIIE